MTTTYMYYRCVVKLRAVLTVSAALLISQASHAIGKEFSFVI